MRCVGWPGIGRLPEGFSGEAPRLVLAGGRDDRQASRRLDESSPRRIEESGVGEDGSGVGGAGGLGSLLLFAAWFSGFLHRPGGPIDNFGRVHLLELGMFDG